MLVWVIKMLQYEKIDISEGIDIDKSNKSKICMFWHYWCFKGIADTSESHVCNKYHDISLMAYELKDIAIIHVKGVDYRCVLWKKTRNGAINRLNNSKVDDEGTLYIWILVQIRHLLRYLFWW